MDNNKYDDNSIESLTPYQHVRLRPQMYAGDTSDATHLAIEILGNAIDEYNIGHGDTILVELKDDGSVCIEDYGQGFPINVLREDGETVLQASFDVMNTSAKYRDDGVYEGTAIGLNGVGGKISNFLSHFFEVETRNNKGEYEHLLFKEGTFQTRKTGKDSNTQSGTKITFQPSEEFFENPKVDSKKFYDFCENITCICPGLTIVFNGQKIFHPEGMEDLLSKQIKESIEIVNSHFILEKQVGKQKICAGLTYTSNSSCSITAYVNCGATLAGPHITILKSGLTRTLNKWGKDNNILKSTDKNLDGNSLQEGLILVCNITGEGVAYDAQVKTTITKIDTNFINSTFTEALEIWLDNNPEDAKNIIEKALIARKASEAAKKARERVKTQASEKKDKVFKLPTKLTDCYSKDRSKCELLIAEGKSAASGLVAARDSEFQAVYGVRGKMLSVLKSTPEKILANQEINNIIQALGLDYNPKTAKMIYDKNKLRYGKIIACADADPDGMAIENLLFNILWYLCPDLVIEGHVYSAVPPLFRVTTKNNEYIYLRDDKALEEYRKNHFSEKYLVNRMKGLGECDSEELSDTLLNPETRNVVRLQVNDIGATDDLFEDLYGKRVEPRVKFLLQHSEEGEYDYS
jgi:DNA gyrase subunit B